MAPGNCWLTPYSPLSNPDGFFASARPSMRLKAHVTDPILVVSGAHPISHEIYSTKHTTSNWYRKVGSRWKQQSREKNWRRLYCDRVDSCLFTELKHTDEQQNWSSRGYSSSLFASNCNNLYLICYAIKRRAIKTLGTEVNFEPP